jgi:hypothetical protein
MCLILTESAVLAGTHDTTTWNDPSQVSSNNAREEYNLDDNSDDIWIAKFSGQRGWGKPKHIDKTTSRLSVAPRGLQTIQRPRLHGNSIT